MYSFNDMMKPGPIYIYIYTCTYTYIYIYIRSLRTTPSNALDFGIWYLARLSLLILKRAEAKHKRVSDDLLSASPRLVATYSEMYIPEGPKFGVYAKHPQMHFNLIVVYRCRVLLFAYAI